VRPPVALILLSLLSCSEPAARDAPSYAADPEAARRRVEDCATDGRRVNCDAARAGLAEARRRERMAAYEQSFRASR